jgi:murein DD-endopeptidase MepM/ murein hydrolase activator NlpD
MARRRQRILGGLVTTAVVGGALLAAGPAPASAGGATAIPPSGQPGGTEYGAPMASRIRPVATRFRVAPEQVVAGGRLPSLAVRIDEAGVGQVTARVVLWPVAGKGRIVRLPLGTVATGRTLRPSWPRGTQLAAGRYTVRLHAADPAGHPLLRRRSATGLVDLVVRAPKPVAAPKPKPAPAAPAPAPVVTPAPAPSGSGVFPVGGPHTYGEGFGVDRGDHRHEGQDVLGAEGLPIRAPLAGTVRVTDYQAGGAGEYVVLHTAAGPDFFFAHCVRGSTAVHVGDAVAPGQTLCALGSTGDSTAPHLHFELWPNGWRTGAKDSVPVDPLAQLRAWDH